MGAPSQSNDLAALAVSRVIERMQHDPRLAYLIGPGSQVWSDLTVAYADTLGVDVAEYRRVLADRLTYQRIPGIGSSWIDPEDC